MFQPLRRLGVAIALVALTALPLSGCDVCETYCQDECDCLGDAGDGCQDTCLETMDVYSGDAREQECADRIELLAEECR